MSLVRARRGQLIPMILIALVVMAILGIAVLFTGTSDYAQSALVVYGLKAEQMALSALEEGQAALYEKYNAPVPLPPPAHRVALLDEVRKKSKDQSTVLELDLLKDGDVARAVAVATNSGGRLDAVTAKFYGFRRLKYQVIKGGTDDLFASELIYYHDPTGNFDKSGLQTPEDFVGYYTLTAKATYGKISRELSVTHDIKIVDVCPPARQFAAFSFYSANPEGQGGPPADYSTDDLNNGGGLKIFSNGSGRIFVRGPFLIEPEDFPNGAGGRTPPTCTTFPPEEGLTVREGWHGWAAIPAIRDGMLDRAGWSAFSLAVGPKRPNKGTDTRPFTQDLLGALTGSLMNAVPFFNDDAGWYILESKQQPQWYCGLRSVDTAKDSCFSLVGDPLDPKNGGFSPFVGLVWKYTDKREPAGESSKYLSPDKRSWVEPTPDAEKDFFYSIEAEGGLVGAYNRIKFEHFSDDVLWTTYRCSVVDQVRTPYGYRWEKAYERGWFDKVFGDLFKVTVFYLFGPITGPLGLMALDSLGLVPFGTANPPPNLLSVTPTDVASVFPPGYRLYERAATRRYPSLARVLPPAQSQRPLVLDGVLWVDDLSTDTGFTYKGRGIICSTNPTVKTSDNSKGPRMALPVVPQAAAGADLSKATDYLTLVNTRDEPGKAHLGEQQLELSLVAEAGDQSASVFQGSVVSLQGVRPKEKTVSIAGNMVCGFLNKAKIPEGSRLNVNYNSTLLMGTDSTAGPKFLDGSWHVIALSPRASGWHDR